MKLDFQALIILDIAAMISQGALMLYNNLVLNIPHTWGSILTFSLFCFMLIPLSVIAVCWVAFND